MWIAIAQADIPSLGGLGEILKFGFEALLLWWAFTKGFPTLLARADAQQAEARKDFAAIVDKMETNSSGRAKDGHDAARALSVAIEKQVDAIRGNSSAIDHLTNQVMQNGR